MMNLDKETLWLLSGVILLLIVATIVAYVLKIKSNSEASKATVQNLWDRIKAWWVMCLIFTLALMTGGLGSVLLFFISSLFASQEFFRLVDPNKQDRKIATVIFAIVLPVQYLLVATNWYGMFSIFIPVYAFLFIPILIAIKTGPDNFLSRAAKFQWALMLTIYCISHAPGLLMLKINNYEGNAKLLFYLVLVTQLSDVMQYVFGKIFGNKKIVPELSPNKTWEGFIGGVTVSTIVGGCLYWATPFNWLESTVVALIINLTGFAGGLVMSAVKRGEGTKDYGTMIKGHGGFMDRMDSICFSAPILFHYLRYFYT